MNAGVEPRKPVLRDRSDPVPEGQPRPLAFPGLTELRSPRWCAGDRIIVTGAAAGRPARLWRLELVQGRDALTSASRIVNVR